MRMIARIGMVMVALAMGLVVASPEVSTASAAAQQRSALELRKHKYRLDDGGHLWLAVQLQNVGTRPVQVKGIAVSRFGPWTTLGKNVTPGEVCRGSVKISGDRAATLWVDGSEGLLRFDLPAR